MKANELRIGNIVFNYDGDWIISDGSDIDFAGQNCEAIPLTEEWLLRFGFGVTEYSGQYRGFKENVEILIQEHMCVYKRSLTTYTQIKYVHQLQNLYFALTGEELDDTI